MDIVSVIIGLVIGFLVGFITTKSKKNVFNENETAELKTKNAVQEAAIENVRNENNKLSLQNDNQSKHILQLTHELAIAQKGNENLQENLAKQKQELNQLNERLKIEFENLANKILDEKTRKFTDQNKDSLETILTPFKDRIKEFEDKVQKVYDVEAAERNSLKGEIKQLMSLNQVMHHEAQNLTRALKGDNKTQGNWGEFILESILEKSGLVKDREFKTQDSITTEDGRRLQPDIVIYLPDDKNLIIDSKVSLIGFEKYSSSEDEDVRLLGIKEHCQSVRAHIKSLSDKKYHQQYGIKTLDFVLLFIPIEPAFALAVQHDANLFNDAFEKNIVIVSPTTLLATLRTVSNIWRQENQSKNAFEIAKKAGDLYDKFVGFTEDMIDLGKKMDQGKATYSDAMKKLTDGTGNIVKRVEELKKMGAGTNKSISTKLIERSE
jgi:DNA recombination protein RmuC